jgi:ubiquitin carboxyl-terminal hydrolase 9/24
MTEAQQGVLEPTPIQTAITAPSTEILQLWVEVGNGLEKSQTVIWKRAVESLDAANTFFAISADARTFVERYISQMINILVDQVPSKIGQLERNCVTDSLLLATKIVAQDLQIQAERGGECVFLSTLSLCFNRTKAFYRGAKASWNMNQLQGLPDVRMRVVERFRMSAGFAALERYLLSHIGLPTFPKLDILHHVLQAIGDAALERTAEATAVEEDAILVGNAVMQYVGTLSDDDLKKMPSDQLTLIQRDLQHIFDILISTRRSSTYEFYQFWRSLVLKLISSQSLPLRLFGWEQVGDLIDACADHRPPPRMFVVSGAGCPFVNGEYHFSAGTTPDGYAKPGGEIFFTHVVPDKPEFADQVGKKLTLFRCTMRSQQKWWFLSDADEEQPGTDRDVDYYQHKSEEHEEAYPAPEGWITCRTAGVDPPPTLKSQGVLVPDGQEFNTLEHQLAKWAIENEIVEQVLGDTTIHREVVARSTVLITFLASMCRRGQPSSLIGDGAEPNKYCLQASHLVFAWKTCTRKADAAVSTQVYKLLVSILPLCPTHLAIPLLEAVRASLGQTNEKRHLLPEVGEFCSVLATGSVSDTKVNAGNILLSDEVREEVLNLLWSVLTHPDASSLKSYDSIKQYVTHELRVEPKGSEHRESFLRSCIIALSANAGSRGDLPVDEVQALRMVKLTHFVLEACPRGQAESIAIDNSAALPRLVFHELTAYLERRKKGGTVSVFRRAPQGAIQSRTSVVEAELSQHWLALNDRLRILRHLYGLSGPLLPGNSDPLLINSQMIETLWQLCDSPSDREAAMIFIASASHGGSINQENSIQGPQLEPVLSPAFAPDVCQSVFINLFCSPSFSYDHLGEGAYRSFNFLFNSLRLSPTATAEVKRVALDALWRVCLSVEKDWVASQARRDLLQVYVSERAKTVVSVVEKRNNPLEKYESFGDRVFEVLAKVKRDIENKETSCRRSAQRSLRILNAAIGQVEDDGYSMATSTLLRLSMLLDNTSLDEAVGCLPHGMRGEACCRRIGVVVKRTQTQAQLLERGQPLNESEGDGPRHASVVKFSLNVHPLETLASVKQRVSLSCHCSYSAVKPIQINGRGCVANRSSPESPQMSLNSIPEDSVMDEIGIVHGCEMIFVIADRPTQSNGSIPPQKTARSASIHDLSHVFFDGNSDFSDKLFNVLLDLIEALPWIEQDEMTDVDTVPHQADPKKLAWDLLLAMPTNASIARKVRLAHGREIQLQSGSDAMEVESQSEPWSQLLDMGRFNRSVYVLLTIDAFLQPAASALSTLNVDIRRVLKNVMLQDSDAFGKAFVDSGGFEAVVGFFSSPETDEATKQGEARRGNAVALRILKACVFGQERDSMPSEELDEIGSELLKSLTTATGLMRSLTAMVVDDLGISSSTITDVLRFLRLLFKSPEAAERFINLPNRIAEQFLIVLLWWDGESESSQASSTVPISMQVRKSVHDLILETPVICDCAFPWLIQAVDRVEVTWENATEHFDVLERLVGDQSIARSRPPSEVELQSLATIVCKKLTQCPRPMSESESVSISTSVLCGCLKLLRALIESDGTDLFHSATETLLTELKVARWSDHVLASSQMGRTRISSKQTVLIDLMGAVFDGLLSPLESSTVSVCCDRDSRRRGFDVVGTAARSAGNGGYTALVAKINSLVGSAAPNLRHRWGQFGLNADAHSRSTRGVASKYSGLRNQGCTCYMNSVLQQLFMMPELRDSMCSAPLPRSLRSSGGSTVLVGNDLVGKKISLQWDTGISYDAFVEGFNDVTGMHIIRYCPIQIATVGGSTIHQIQPEDIDSLPPVLPEEFILTEGRSGMETGVYDVVSDVSENLDGNEMSSKAINTIQETEDEKTSRHLLEEFQRTFIHLQEGSKGRCFDPRTLVEACACLKLEFDVWQQNDASEFATKLLDRLEIALRRWAPEHFRYMDHTFGLKQTKQKICKQCGMKSNREEKLLNIDCQIRGKSDIHEALAAMTDTELMEGSNKVFCDNCKVNTDTVLRTAISTLPNMLILSLKRFDLDYNTFETVKLNSRCAFGQTLNMKPYMLEGLEEAEQGAQGPSPMETEDANNSVDVNISPAGKDEDYEYKLAGVLVHAGVAQGGHYYSFIKDRNPGSEEKWYRFDDEDVTPFDPAAIETECFGGKVKKETKWPNGQLHTIEQEQFANALMLFYEKVKSSDLPPPSDNPMRQRDLNTSVCSTGFDAFEPDVRRANATHRWQSFLFDAEFHAFLKGILGICRIGNPPGNGGRDDWQKQCVPALLSFVFDVLLYSSDRSALNDWTQMLEEILLSNQEVSKSFVHHLAQKCDNVSDNWVRTFLLECPDQSSRQAAVRIFSAAFQSCARLESELKALADWTAAWKQQMEQLSVQQREANRLVALPCVLEREWKGFEDTNKLDGSASSMGKIISFLNVLLEALPRSFRFNAEVFTFVRNLATMLLEGDENPFTLALIEALIPARLVTLAVRDRVASPLCLAFPGLSVPVEVARSQLRAESNASSHMMSMNTNHSLNGPDMNSIRGPTHSDLMALFEALVCILGLPGAVHVPIVRDLEDLGRGRHKFALNETTVKALTAVFQECCSPGAPGMGQREIEIYLSRCDVDAANVSKQKINDIMSKYPIAKCDHDLPGSNFLSLEGFLAYYEDTVQTNDVRVRADLHTFGFRPDLTRRSRLSRLVPVRNQEKDRKPPESVAIDVAETFRDGFADLGRYGNLGLSSSPALFVLADSVSEALSQYLIAAATYRRDTNSLTLATLQEIHRTPNDWNGSESIGASLNILMVIAATPDDDQDERISRIMSSQGKAARNVEYGAGILQVLRAFFRTRQAQQFSNEMRWGYERYVGLLKELRRVYPVFVWMNNHRDQWSFVEREVLDSASRLQGKFRTEYVHRVPDHAIQSDHNSHADSDMANINDSDDDSQLSPADHYNGREISIPNSEANDGPYQIVVEGAGNSSVNGVYHQCGYFEGGCRYAMSGNWRNERYRFFIFQCNVSNNTKHWYISIVPYDSQPGTSADIDFYTAPATSDFLRVPPHTGWVKSQEGTDPLPRLTYKRLSSEGGTPERVLNGSVLEESDKSDSPYI